MDSVLDFSLQRSWCSDSDRSSISSAETLSPVHSMDSSLSPSYQLPPQSTPKTSRTGYPHPRSSSYSRSSRGRPGRGPRVRSQQRESASEKEKLRMRDLTKALHHLRSYLPPSVAPAGQTLTKIETLRLTIRYIASLSAQLGLSEEVLFQRRERGDSGASSPDILGFFRHGSDLLQTQNQFLYQSQFQEQPAAVHSGSCVAEALLYGGRYGDAPQSDANMTPSCQMCSENQDLAPLDWIWT